MQPWGAIAAATSLCRIIIIVVSLFPEPLSNPAAAACNDDMRALLKIELSLSLSLSLSSPQQPKWYATLVRCRDIVGMHEENGQTERNVFQCDSIKWGSSFKKHSTLTDKNCIQMRRLLLYNVVSPSDPKPSDHPRP